MVFGVELKLLEAQYQNLTGHKRSKVIRMCFNVDPILFAFIQYSIIFWVTA